MDKTHTTQVENGNRNMERKISGRNWLLTINNYSQEELEIVQDYCKTCKWYSYQEEKGELTGTIHLQVAFAFKNSKDRSALVNRLPRAVIFKAKNMMAVLNYCKKGPTATGKNQDSKLPEKLKSKKKKVGCQICAAKLCDRCHAQLSQELADEYMRNLYYDPVWDDESDEDNIY